MGPTDCRKPRSSPSRTGPSPEPPLEPSYACPPMRSRTPSGPRSATPARAMESRCSTSILASGTGTLRSPFAIFTRPAPTSRLRPATSCSRPWCFRSPGASRIETDHWGGALEGRRSRAIPPWRMARARTSDHYSDELIRMVRSTSRERFRYSGFNQPERIRRDVSRARPLHRLLDLAEQLEGRSSVRALVVGMVLWERTSPGDRAEHHHRLVHGRPHRTDPRGRPSHAATPAGQSRIDHSHPARNQPRPIHALEFFSQRPRGALHRTRDRTLLHLAPRRSCRRRLHHPGDSLPKTLRRHPLRDRRSQGSDARGCAGHARLLATSRRQDCASLARAGAAVSGGVLPRAVHRLLRDRRAFHGRRQFTALADACDPPVLPLSSRAPSVVRERARPTHRIWYTR